VAANPNVAGVVVVSLGCESVDAVELTEGIADFGKPVELIQIEKLGGTLEATCRGARAALRMVLEASRLKREKVGLDSLMLGLECGGSDPASGLTANPVLGYATDRIVEAGGGAIITETTESIGAEHVLARRAVSTRVGEKMLEIVRRYEERVRQFGADIREGQPVPGNIEAGLTTAEEKSLGCVLKAGSSPLVEVVEFAVIPNQKGLVVMDTPGFDPISMGGLLAGGCQVICFTTGRGSPSGVPIAPVIKISSNSECFQIMNEHIDFNAGTVIDGEEKIEQAGERLLDLIIEVANGAATKAEALGHNLFGVWTHMQL
jgi:altronate dehydratase large subunit